MSFINSFRLKCPIVNGSPFLISWLSFTFSVLPNGTLYVFMMQPSLSITTMSSTIDLTVPASSARMNVFVCSFFAIASFSFTLSPSFTIGVNSVGM